MKMNGLLVLALLAAVACAKPREDTGADSNALPAIDTLKAAPTDTLASRDTLAAKATPTSAAARKPGTSSSTKKPAAADTTKLGRDVAIPFDPTKRRLPTVDTAKKKPPLSS